MSQKSFGDSPSALYHLRSIVVGPGRRLAIRPADWAGCLIAIKGGPIEVHGRMGARIRLSDGAILWFAGLPIAAISNTGTTPATLAALSRGSSPRGSRPFRSRWPLGTAALTTNRRHRLAMLARASARAVD